MKTKLLVIALALPLVFGCRKFDDSHLWNSINNLNNRVERLEDLCDRMNANISSLQVIVQALQTNDAIKSVTSLPNGEGYTIIFASGKSINIYNGTNGVDGKDGVDGKPGEDGENGVTPIISVKKDSDDVYYWTVNGDWLIVDGHKVKAVGTDGSNGHAGIDGINGEDGITLQFKIEDGYWYISYDNKESWEQLGKATGDNGLNGADGESFFEGVSIENGYVCFILNDELLTEIRLPFISVDELIVDLSSAGSLSSVITENQERLTIKLKLLGKINNDDINYIRLYMPNIEYLDLSETNLSIVPVDGFADMARLKEVILPMVCFSIENDAFDNCNILKHIKAPNASVPVSSIDKCLNLKEMFVGNIIGNYTNTSMDLYLTGGENGEINSGTIIVNSITFYKSVVKITALTAKCKTVIFEPDAKISTIPNGIFSHNDILEEVLFPKYITEIGPSAFCYCHNLQKVTFPEGCRLLTLPQKGRYYGGGYYSTFSETAIKSIVLPSSIETINGSPFYNCQQLSRIEFEYSTDPCVFNIDTNGSETIGTFHNIPNLTEIICRRTIPPVCSEKIFNGLREQFFYDCTLYVPSSVIYDYKTDTCWRKFKNILPIEEL